MHFSLTNTSRRGKAYKQRNGLTQSDRLQSSRLQKQQQHELTHMASSRLWVFSKRGPVSEVLSLTSRSLPTLPPALPLPLPRDVPQPEEWLLVKVAFAGLNPGAIFQMTIVPAAIRRGTCTPEMDLSGVVVDVWHPDGQGRFKKGDAVVAMVPAAHALGTGTGALAEHIIVPARYVVQKPEGVKLSDAAGVMLPALTAWELVEGAKLEPGNRVLVNAAAGGIGSMAVQMVRNVVGKDGHIVGVCGRGKESIVKGLGADEVIDYSAHANLSSHLATSFSSQPFDAIIDAIGVHALFVGSPSYLVPTGKYSAVGVRPPDFSFPSFLRAALRMKLNEWWPVSPWLGGFGRWWHGVAVMAPTLEDRQRAVDLLGNGQIRVLRDSVWAFEDVKQAYEHLGAGHVTGKVLVKVDSQLNDDA
ncbi:Zinc-type alcohol dehydrogenase-like protein [Paramyrothecium foliicola]|nr:Zinc-type alcohol dehydrogenase-like protein [Paramyrothecium foliicola]